MFVSLALVVSQVYVGLRLRFSVCFCWYLGVVLLCLLFKENCVLFRLINWNSELSLSKE